MLFATISLFAVAVSGATTSTLKPTTTDSSSTSKTTQLAATAACSTACSPFASVVASCNLPSLVGPYPNLTSTIRNLTGATYGSMDAGSRYGDSGPETDFLSSYQQAKCLCTAGIKFIQACDSCLFSSGGPDDMSYVMERVYGGDCEAFGYWPWTNESSHSPAIPLGVPSTTITALPSQTSLPPSSTTQSLSKCQPCDIIEQQLEQCGLPDLVTGVPLRAGQFNTVNGTSFPYSYLSNRTIAESFCTLPVLRNIPACRTCFLENGGSDEVAASTILNAYSDDCHNLGYWSDSQVAEYTVPVQSAGLGSADQNRFGRGYSIVLGLGFTFALFSSL
jgi:hypothetical protein